MIGAAMPKRLATYAGFVKLEHSVFSLPLVFAGAWLALRQAPEVGLLGLILAAAVSGRVIGMALNRIIDAEIDARNPRTRNRELPRGAISRAEAWLVLALAGLFYIASAWAIAPICLWLSPIPVLLFTLYPYLKRWTMLAHLGLGLAWSLGPVGGWLAASPWLESLPGVKWLWGFSLCWVTGFDIIYATLDEQFDRQAGLRSLPARLGRRPALRIAAVLHALAFAALVQLWAVQLRTPAGVAWLAVIAGLLIWEHAVAERRPEFAFFQLNGLVGFLVFALILSG